MNITVSETKRMLAKNNRGFDRRLVVKEISGNNSQGYDFAVVYSTWNDEYGYWSDDIDNVLATTSTVWHSDKKNKKGELGAFSPEFNKSEIDNLIAETYN